MIARLRRAVSGRGPAELAELVAKNVRHLLTTAPPEARAALERDLEFDRAWGTETSEMRDMSSLNVPIDRARQAVRYQPSPIERLHALIDGLAIDYQAYRFVDYGCGKGRVLLAASLRPFAEVIGVEFAPELCGIAERNYAAFAKRAGSIAPIRIVQGDAAAFEPPDSPLVLYFYNPFNEQVMAPVARTIERSLTEQPRDIRLIYLDPRHLAVWERSGRWTTERQGNTALLRSR